MQQQRQDYKIPYHFAYIKKLLIELLKQPGQKYQSILLTKRTAQIVFSIVSEAELFSCGFKKIVLSANINPYMTFEEVVLVFTLSGPEDYEEISQFSQKIDKVFLVNLGICTQQSKSLLKKLSFREADSIRGFKQQNLDFFCYLQNTFVLTTRNQAKDNSKQNKNNKKLVKSISQETAIDRLCSLLFSYQNFSQFEFYLPKNKPKLSKNIKQTMETKLKILSKYDYKGFDKNAGMMGVKTKVIVLQRVQQISPFILCLYYGPLVEELNLTNTCRFLTSHSTIYNTLYHLDFRSAAEELTSMLEDLSENKKKQINSTDLKQAKKVLQKAYNPNLSKQELSFHKNLLDSLSEFMKNNCELLVLQQTIANKVNDVGQKMRGSSIVNQVYNWCMAEQNSGKYGRYLGLVVQALSVHNYWWYQRKQLMAGISDKADLEAVQRFSKQCKPHSLQQKPVKKDKDGVEIRERCFRHHPQIIDQFLKIENEVKEKKLETCELLKISQQDVSLAKKTRTVVYINSTIGYNELAMLLALRKPDIQFVCRDLKNTRQWTDHLLFTQ